MEHFKELEKKVEEILEAMILAKGYEDLIEDLYYEFCEWVYAETNAQIRKEYGANYANKKVDMDKVIFDDKDVDKVCEYMAAYEKNKTQTNLNKAKLVLETEGNHIHNHLMYEKLADGATAIYVEGGGGCDRCLNGMIEIKDDVKLPPYHPGCLCHITEFYMEDDDI